MTRRSRSRTCIEAGLMLGVALIVTGCSAADLPTLARDGSNVLVDVDGAASISRFGWAANQFVPARFGATVRLGDLVELDEGAMVTLVCADLSLRALEPGTHPVPCLPHETALNVRGAPSATARAADSTPFQILAPRAPLIRSDRPLFRWEPLSEADGYSITLSGGGLSWSERTTTPAIGFPATLEPLSPETDFVLTVEAYTLLGGTEAEATVQFRTLSAESARTLETLEKEIAALPLDGPARDLVLANLYASNRLFGDALALIEPIYVAQPEPPLALLLGDLSLQIGLVARAESHYRAAHELADALGDIEGRARAALQLARIELCSRSDAAATTLWQEAVLADALRLGDEALEQGARALSGANACAAKPPGASSTGAP